MSRFKLSNFDLISSNKFRIIVQFNTSLRHFVEHLFKLTAILQDYFHLFLIEYFSTKIV